MLPLVIYDFKVLCHNVLHEIKDVNPINQIDCIKAYWAYVFFRGPLRTKYFNHKTIVVDDGGTEDYPYWRKSIYPEYKAGRRPKSDLFYRIVEYGIQTIEKINIDYYNIPTFEADDLAGHMVKIKRLYQSFDPNSPLANRIFYLLTVDSDWLQLTGEGVFWINTGPWEPILRGAPETIEWTKKRLKRDISHPQEIVAIKSIQGDKSDNLPPGCDPYLIDLVNPPAGYNLNNHPISHLMKQSLIDEKVTVDFNKAEKAHKLYLKKRLGY